MIALDKTGTHLKYFSQKQDVILIKNLLASVQHRWEKIVSRSAERTRHLEKGYKEAKQVKNHIKIVVLFGCVCCFNFHLLWYRIYTFNIISCKHGFNEKYEYQYEWIVVGWSFVCCNTVVSMNIFSSMQCGESYWIG